MTTEDPTNNGGVPGAEPGANQEPNNPQNTNPNGNGEGGNGEGKDNPAAGDNKTILGGTDKKDGDNPAGDNTVPEKYDFASVVPEGMQLDEKNAAEFSAMAKELGLSQDNAAKMAGYGMKYASGLMQAFEAKQQEQSRAWAEDTKAKLGADFDKTVSLAGVAMERLATKIPNIREIVNHGGLGNRYEIVQAFAEMGKAFSEDGGHNPGAPAAAKKQETWYPNSKF